MSTIASAAVAKTDVGPLALRFFAIMGLGPVLTWAFLLTAGGVFGHYGAGHWWDAAIGGGIFCLLGLWTTRHVSLAPACWSKGHRQVIWAALGVLCFLHVVWAMLMFASSVWVEPKMVSSMALFEDFKSVKSASHLVAASEADPDFGVDGRLKESIRPARCQTANALVDGFRQRQVQPSPGGSDPLAVIFANAFSSAQVVAGCMTESRWQDTILASNASLRQEKGNRSLAQFIVLDWTPEEGLVTAASMQDPIFEKARVTREKACGSLVYARIHALGQKVSQSGVRGYCASLPDAGKVAVSRADLTLPSDWQEKLAKN
jgi:hypothetical protein